MLRRIRIVLSVVMLSIVNLLFIGGACGVSHYIAWAAKIQFVPALLALDYAVLFGLILLTFVFGRIYCSVICPLGVMQDIFGWLGKKQRHNRYTFSPEKKVLRYTVAAVFFICLIIGFAPVTTLLAPYSAYGRMVTALFRPLFDLLQNGLSALETGHDSYLFAPVDVWMRSVTTFVVALFTLVIPAILAWRNGRTYCNTVCPVGTVLSLLSRFSVFRIRLDKDKCRDCSLCEKNCKASAIDFKSGTVDASRCVMCGDCIDVCHFDAVKLCATLPEVAKSTKSGKQTSYDGIDDNRRAFLAGGLMAAGSVAMAQTRMKMDGGLAILEDKQAPHRLTLVTPPGSVSAHHLARHCTACQLCVSACPNNVLRPATDPLRFMQPQMSFERGYCRPECTRCGKVCPTGAIKPFTKEEKTAIHVGHAVWIAGNCIPVTNGDSCNNCARHCPAGAITMTETSRSNLHVTTAAGLPDIVTVPVIDRERCIGCGACENLCPARPFSAVYVEGHEMHHIG